MSQSDLKICNGEDLMTPCELSESSLETMDWLLNGCSASCASAYDVFWDLCESMYTDPASDYWMGSDKAQWFQLFDDNCQLTLDETPDGDSIGVSDKNSGSPTSAAALASALAVALGVATMA